MPSGLTDKLATNAATELQWFDKVAPVLTLAQLEKGDILLKKDYGDSGVETSPIVGHQRKLLKSMAAGSPHTCHAALYLGGGKIANASAHNKSVCVLDLAGYYPNVPFLVYRLKAPRKAAPAAELATKWTSKKPAIGYSYVHCLTAGILPHSYGDHAKADAAKVKAGTPPYDAMMCSEFVVYMFQQEDTEKPAIDLHARNTSPMRLEHWLNTDGKDRFDFKGRIRLPKK